jgi:low affinity Fe/Cu permease
MTPFQVYLAISPAPVATMVTVLVGVLVNNSVMNAQIKRLDEKIDNRFTRLDEKIDNRFMRLDEKLDERLARLDEKLDSTSEVLTAHFRRFEDMLLGKLAELDTRLTRIEAHLNLR